MTDLQAQAAAFAAMMMKEFSGDTFNREDMYHAYRDAYEQGWVDRDKPTTEMCERLKAAIQERINELKAEFEQL